MSTKTGYERSKINGANKAFSASRTTIESGFYGNNVTRMNDLKKAYELAYNCMGTVVTDMPVYQPEKIGLPKDARILLFNNGEVIGRFAGARIIQNEGTVTQNHITSILREAVYKMRYKKLYHAESYIGLDGDFMAKAHLLVPEKNENLMYNWLLNFQYITDEYEKMYKASKSIADEPDILVLSDPDWTHPDYPDGIAYFDSEHNCAALLGLKYFGEHKKGTLTLAWALANRNGYASCHGGLKKITQKDGKSYVMGVFGLSGSGKSTLTHAKHDGKYQVAVLHDDAYIISTEDGSTVALEPSYFDKTQDYPLTSPDNKFLLSVQNCGATVDDEGKVVILTEDVRNGNGRAIKSKLWTDNRVDKMDEPIDAIAWIMRDHALPPILKIDDPVLAAVMGATLATKRSSAEKLAEGIDMDALVFEPYANPFRTYALKEDYEKFKYLFEKRDVDCYIINTGHFVDKKIPKEVTIGVMEQIIEGTGDFKPFGKLAGMYTMDVPGFEANFADANYNGLVKKAMQNRVLYLESLRTFKKGKDELPQETIDVLKVLL